MSDDAIQTLLTAIRAPDQLPAFTRKLRDLIGADAAVLRFVNTRTWRFPLTATCGNAPFTDAFFTAYDRDFAKSDLHARVAMRKTLPRAHVYFCHEHYPAEARAGDPYFEFIGAHGVAWTAGYMAQLSECEAVAFCAVRSPARAPFGEHERESLYPIAFHLGAWAQAFWFARKTAAAAHAAQRALDLQLTRAICVDDERRPLWESQDIDLAAAGLERFEGRIRAAWPPDEPMLSAAVARAIESPSAAPSMLRLRPGEIGICGDGAQSGPHAVLLCLGGAQQLADISVPGSVTVAEKETVSMLAQGLSPDEIARRRGVGVSTVRTQIKRVYRKLGVHSLAQLLVALRAD